MSQAQAASAPLSIPSQKESGSRPLKAVIRVAITIAIVTLVFWQVSWTDVRNAALQLDYMFAIWVVILWVPNQYFQYLRWKYLAEQCGPNVSTTDIRRGYWVGYTLGIVTPGRLGTYGRALALKNCSLARAAGVTFIERNYSSFVLNGCGFIALALLPALGWKSPLPAGSVWFTVLFIAIGLGFLMLAIFPGLLVLPLQRLISKLPFRDKLLKALETLKEIRFGQGLFLTALAAAALSCALLQFVFLVRGMGINLPVFAGMLAVLLNFLLKGFLPISIGNLGIGEWTAMLCLAGLGVDAPIAVAASLLLFIANVFVPAMIGLPFIGSLRPIPRLSSKPES